MSISEWCSQVIFYAESIGVSGVTEAGCVAFLKDEGYI